MGILFDENLPSQLVEAFKLLEGQNKLSVNGQINCYHVVAEAKSLNLSILPGEKSYTDAQVIDVAINLNAWIVTQDTDFKKIKIKGKLALENGVGIVFLKSKPKQKYWDTVTNIFLNWEKIKAKIKDAQSPCILEVSESGVSLRAI